jgi:hypothetical protein
MDGLVSPVKLKKLFLVCLQLLFSVRTLTCPKSEEEIKSENIIVSLTDLNK